MIKRKLPAKGSREERILKLEYPTATKARIEEWTTKFGFASVASFMEAVRKGLKLNRRIRAAEADDINAKELIVNLPPVNIILHKAPSVEMGDEETIVVLASDGHAGKITKSYNRAVYDARMETMYHSIMTIVELHRHMYDINNIHIINLGDNVQGDNPFQGSRIGSTEMGARDQVKKIAVPKWNDLLGSLKGHFKTVNFDGFPGNHGHDKLSPETSRYDLLFYDVLEAGIGQHEGINVTVHDEFADIVNICGFKFFCFHGDGMPCQQGVPFFALDKKLKSWYMQFGGFNYAASGHFHKRHSDEIGSKFEYFMCSTLVSDDKWALKKLGISSNPSQWILGVHPKMGVTWRYPLIVDYKFLPEK